jgi:outer membrane protein assembly factor BamB
MRYLMLAAAMTMAAQMPSQWPGLWGPNRDAAAVDAAAPARPSGFKELWRRKTSGGYAEVIAGAGLVFTMELRDGADHAIALDAATGRERWRTVIGPTYRGHDGSHDGPIGTPTLAGMDVFVVGPNGHLVALNAETGRERWRHDLVAEFRAQQPAYGFAASPLVVDGLVIVQTGGAESRGLLAFERATGTLAWSAPETTSQGYASPSVGTLAGTRQIVASAGDFVFAVDPSGRLLWKTKGSSPGEEAGNPPMLLPDDRVLATFWGEAVMLKIARGAGGFTATEVWRSPRLRNAHAPTIYRDGHLYGFAGAMLVCVDAATGDVKWRERTYEGTLVRIGSHLLMLSQSSGDISVIEASPARFREIARARVFTPGATSMTGPSVAGRRVYVRNVEEIVALAIEGQS